MKSQKKWLYICLFVVTSAIFYYVWHAFVMPYIDQEDAHEGAVRIPFTPTETIPNNVNVQYIGNLAHQMRIDDLTNSLPRSNTKSYPSRSLSQIDQIVLHHSATADTATAASFANYHINNRGWPAIGYHIVITNQGTVQITNPLTVVSNHVQGANTRSVGICISGTFDKKPPTDLQLAGLIAAIRWVEGQIGRSLIYDKHNRYANKTCPGTMFPDIQTIQTLTYA
jgi:N-acetylmuramoyl-L-alanine amidase